ncbi:growth/differentiatio [Pholidichthys leucotaenia]
MEKQTLMPLVLGCLRTAVLLLICGPHPTASSGALPRLGDLTDYPPSGVFSPLIRALSEHGGSRWSSGTKRQIKPEYRYVKYLTEVYRESSRVRRSADGREGRNTVRLIRARDECAVRQVSFMQDLSYSLNQVRKNEQLLKSALLYSFDHDDSAPNDSLCYISIREQEPLDQCPLCPGVNHTINFTASTNGRGSRNWVEVSITSFIQPVLKLQRTSIKLLVNITCPEMLHRTGKKGHKGPVGFTLRSPRLLLYLNDTSKTVQGPPISARSGQRPPTALNTFQKMVLKPERIPRHKRRRKRESPKNKRGEKSLDAHLPELLSGSEFPTSDCALYDFRVRFSQLKLDHWIVFPPKYNPRYCRGVCPRTMGFIYGSPVHTMVQNIIYEKLDSSVPRPSCVPSHYSPLSVMIFEEDGSYVYKEFENMIATRCTCR